jgi:hypothetical protein
MQDPVYRIVHIVAQSKRKICRVANEIGKVANKISDNIQQCFTNQAKLDFNSDQH